MKKLPICFSLLATLLVCGSATTGTAASTTGTSSRRTQPQYGTITGLVRDQQGRPLAGAVIRLLRDGASAVVRETKSTADGAFSVRAAPGRYVLQAVLAGFGGAQSAAVNVGTSDKLVHDFDLQPIGEGRTTAEQRPDRAEAKFRVRAAHTRRSVFQIDEGAGQQTITLARDVVSGEANNAQILTSGVAREEARDSVPTPLDGAFQSYFATTEGGIPYLGFNFALAQRLSDRLRFVVSGQTGTAHASDRLDVRADTRLNERHVLRTRVGAARFAAETMVGATQSEDLGQVSLQAVDEWIVRDGIVVVLGFDYARFLGRNGKGAISPRLGFQFDADATTRLRVAYAPGAKRDTPGAFGRVEFEDGDVVIDDAAASGGAQAVATRRDGSLRVERTRRLEFGVERVLDNSSRVEATAFFDTTDDRGIGLLSAPTGGLRGEDGAEFFGVAEQEGAARGVRVLYARRLNSRASLSAGYSFGRGQSLSPDAANLSTLAPQDVFRSAYFHTGAAQVDADFETGTQVQAVVRFSSQATVFAVDPFAGQLAVYDPSLSILVAQELPTFGLPLRLRALVDARNLLDTGVRSEEGESSVLLGSMRRSVRGGIAVQF